MHESKCANCGGICRATVTGIFICTECNLPKGNGPKGLKGFARRLSFIRERRNMTQEEVSQKTGLQAAAISHFECARRLPSVKNLRTLCASLNVSADYLIDLP